MGRPKYKVTELQVDEMVQLRAQGWLLAAIAARFGVAQSTLSYHLLRRSAPRVEVPAPSEGEIVPRIGRKTVRQAEWRAETPEGRRAYVRARYAGAAMRAPNGRPRTAVRRASNAGLRAGY